MSHWRNTFKNWARSFSLGGGRQAIRLQDAEALSTALTHVTVQRSGPVLIVAPDSAASEQVQADTESFLTVLNDSRPVFSIPEVSCSRPRAWLPENEAARCAALDRALQQEPAVFFASVHALMSRTIPPAEFAAKRFTLQTGANGISPEQLAVRLIELDYDNELEVHAPGEFARRGGILDLFSPLHEAPVRIEFFGDTIESMRSFMPDTQRSFREVNSIHVAARGAVLEISEHDDDENGDYVASYFDENTCLVVCDPEKIRTHLEQFNLSAELKAWSQLLSTRRERVLMLPPFSEVPAGLHV